MSAFKSTKGKIGLHAVSLSGRCLQSQSTGSRWDGCGSSTQCPVLRGSGKPSVNHTETAAHQTYSYRAEQTIEKIKKF